MIIHGKSEEFPLERVFDAQPSGTDHPRARNPCGDNDHTKQDASNGLIDAWDSKGGHTHDDEIEKRERAKEDVADAAGGAVHLRLSLPVDMGGLTIELTRLGLAINKPLQDYSYQK